MAQVEIQIVPDGNSLIAKQDQTLSPDQENFPWTAVLCYID
jgi:hypothetical protein